MEVILREHVDNLGQRGEVVKVANGYARNYLLPRKLALLVTEGNKRQIERERVKFDAKEAEEKKVVEALADRLRNVEVVIARRVGETDALYGSVTSSDIADALAAKGFEIDRRKIQLADALKKVGEVEVPVKLHREITVPLKVKVVAEGSQQ
jgi:large subunit ribosomal protein L9